MHLKKLCNCRVDGAGEPLLHQCRDCGIHDCHSRRPGHPYVSGVKIADQDTATIGTYHTADIPYWFDTLDKYNMIRPTRNWTAWDRTLSERMLSALIAFAKTGNPSTRR